MDYVYELVDNTSDEMYYSHGIWLTLDEAVHELNLCKEPFDIDDSDYCVLEIRIRRIGWGSGFYKRVYSKTFKQLYDEEADEYIWLGIVIDEREEVAVNAELDVQWQS